MKTLLLCLILSACATDPINIETCAKACKSTGTQMVSMGSEGCFCNAGHEQLDGGK